MTSSLDVAGLVPAVAAAVHAAAVVVQMCWDRRQRTAEATQAGASGAEWHRCEAGLAALVTVRVAPGGAAEVAISVRAGGAYQERTKENGPW